MSADGTHATAQPADCPHEPMCLKDVREIRSVVFGNNHPEKSLLVRMERVESRLAAIQKLSLATLCGVGLWQTLKTGHGRARYFAGRADAPLAVDVHSIPEFC
ncbi:MAG: hypothetical protein KKB50_02955 [Planctomycetes bacterium]|nr:hypothetical protein [Planctomycetota bacterium]